MATQLIFRLINKCELIFPTCCRQFSPLELHLHQSRQKVEAPKGPDKHKEVVVKAVTVT